jgi:hypothetical protein
LANAALMQVLQGSKTRSEILTDMDRIDDDIYIETGYKKEHITKAVEFYGIQKKPQGGQATPPLQY